MRTPVLSTARLELRPFMPETISDRYVSWLNDPDVVRYSEQRHRKATRESCAVYVAAVDHEHAHLWAIALQGRHIGNISAHRDLPNATADVGILLGERSEWGRGYGAEAWQAVCDWLLSDGIRKVTAGCMAANAGMLAIFAKTGMQIEGRRAAQFLLNGEPVDMVYAARYR